MIFLLKINDRKDIQYIKLGGDNVTEAHMKEAVFPEVNTREIDWVQYLDFTRVVEAEEFENEQLAKFRNDFNL